MQMAIFNQRYGGPDDQAVRDRKPVDAGTTGPYSPAGSNPTSYKNQFVSQLKKNPPSQQFYSQVFSAQDAEESQNKIDSFTDQPNFFNPGDQALAKDFLAKYIQGGERGLVLPEEQITDQTVSAFQRQQPGQGIGDGNVTAASRIKYPGATGTQVS
jgi:hypothetical protein